MKEEMEKGGLAETNGVNTEVQILLDKPQKMWLIYPESKFSTLWDLLMAS
jgi:hypothetical protein